MPDRKAPSAKQKAARAKFAKRAKAAAKYRKAHPGTSMAAAMRAVK